MLVSRMEPLSLPTSLASDRERELETKDGLEVVPLPIGSGVSSYSESVPLPTPDYGYDDFAPPPPPREDNPQDATLVKEEVRAAIEPPDAEATTTRGKPPPLDSAPSTPTRSLAPGTPKPVSPGSQQAGKFVGETLSPGSQQVMSKEFVMNIEPKDGKRLGLEVYVKNGMLTVKNISPGLFMDYNRTCNPLRTLDIGDVFLSANGAAKDPKAMLKQIGTANKLELVIRKAGPASEQIALES